MENDCIVVVLSPCNPHEAKEIIMRKQVSRSPVHSLVNVLGCLLEAQR